MTATALLDGRERALLQRRTLRVLVAAQVLGGAAIASVIAVSALIARDLFGRDSLAGSAQATLTLGAAAAAVPLARYVSRHGRRPGLRTAFLVGAGGAALVVAADLSGWWPLFVLGMFGLGTGQAANLQTRFAAADLAPPEGRAKAIGLVVWATTVGSMLGPNLLGVTTTVSEAVGLPELSGQVLLALLFDLGACLVVAVFLRPDPLVVAGGLTTAGQRRPTLAHSLRVVWTRPAARLALLGMATAHAVMVGVMSMTPLHLDDGGQSPAFIGFVISVHIAGMYALSPVAGWLADRLGRLRALALGAAILVLATEMSGHTSGSESGMMLGALFLLGLGWSLCLIAGSALLTESMPDTERVAAQGASDLSMSLAGGLAGLSAGFVVAAIGYHHLSHVGMVAAAAMGTYAAWFAWVGPQPVARPG